MINSPAKKLVNFKAKFQAFIALKREELNIESH